MSKTVILNKKYTKKEMGEKGYAINTCFVEKPGDTDSMKFSSFFPTNQYKVDLKKFNVTETVTLLEDGKYHLVVEKEPINSLPANETRVDFDGVNFSFRMINKRKDVLDAVKDRFPLLGGDVEEYKGAWTLYGKLDQRVILDFLLFIQDNFNNAKV